MAKSCKKRDASGDLRNYCKETKYESSPQQKKNRAARNAARRELGLKRGDPREADHRRPLAKGGSTDRSNLRAISRHANRSAGGRLRHAR